MPQFGSLDLEDLHCNDLKINPKKKPLSTLRQFVKVCERLTSNNIYIF